jgi:hypothetical protein
MSSLGVLATAYLLLLGTEENIQWMTDRDSPAIRMPPESELSTVRLLSDLQMSAWEPGLDKLKLTATCL